MDNLHRNRSEKDLRKKRSESVETKLKDINNARPRTPRDPCWTRNREISFSDGQKRYDNKKGEEMVKDSQKSLSEKVEVTHHLQVNCPKTDTKFLAWETRKNEKMSLNRGSRMSRIPIASPRKNLDTCIVQTDLFKEERLLKRKIKRSKIPVKIQTKYFDASPRDQHREKKARGMDGKKQVLSSNLKRSKIPVLMQRITKKVVAKDESVKASCPRTPSKMIAYTNQGKEASEMKPASKTTGENVTYANDTSPSTKLNLDIKKQRQLNTTQEYEARTMKATDLSCSEKTNSSVTNIDQASCEMTNEKISHLQSCELFIVYSNKLKSRRLKKRRERKSHIRVDDSSSAEELGEKMCIESKRRVRTKRKRTSSQTKQVRSDGRTVEMKIPNAEEIDQKTANDGKKPRIPNAEITKNISDLNGMSKRPFHAESFEDFTSRSSSHLTEKITSGQDGLSSSSSLSSHLSDVQHRRGGKTLIKFVEEVELVRHEDLSAEIQPLKSHSGSNLRNVQQLSFIEHVQKTWKRFKNLFKCCICCKEEL